MSQDFRSLLRGLSEVRTRQAAAAAPDPSTELRTLRTAVRRRRLARTSSTVAAAAAVLVVGAVAVQGLQRPEPVPPAPPVTSTSTPSATPSSTPSAPATTTPTPIETPASPASPTAAGLLPSALPVTEEVLAGTDDDWIIAGYMAFIEDRDELATAEYLVSPHGDFYRLPVSSLLVDWLPGTSSALLVDQAAVPALTDVHLADLATGHTRATFSAPDGQQITLAALTADGAGVLLAYSDLASTRVERLVRLDLTGHVLAEYPGYPTRRDRPGVLSPDRSTLLLEDTRRFGALNANDFAPVALTGEWGTDCQVTGWLDAHSWVGVRCASRPTDEALSVGSAAVLGEGPAGAGPRENLGLQHDPAGRYLVAAMRSHGRLLVVRYGASGTTFEELSGVDGRATPLDLPDLGQVAVTVNDHVLLSGTGVNGSSTGIIWLDPVTGERRDLLTLVDGSGVYAGLAYPAPPSGRPLGGAFWSTD